MKEAVWMGTTRFSDDGRLAELGLSVDIITRALRRADAETLTSTDLDPPIMEGLLRWGRTTRFLREELIGRGWSYDNPRNLARTIHPTGDFAIVVATGDERTALADHDPGPKHSRGYATEQAIHANGQLSFEFGALIYVTQAGQAAGLGALRTWLLLYYAAAGGFQVELSLPEAIEGGRITRWTERILLPAIPRQPRKPVGVGPRMHQLLLR
jgi:hypothetical protein